MTTLRRALLLGLWFGIAAATVELWMNLMPFIMRRFGPGPGFMARVVLMEIGLGTLLGLLAAPLLRFGAIVHVCAVALAWFGLERWVGLDSPLFLMQQWAVPLGGLVLFGLGAALGRWSRTTVRVTSAVLIAAGLAAPTVYLRATAPPEAAALALPEPRPKAPDIVLIVLDTVRAENLSTYGYQRDTGPAVSALAREGALFLDATSPSTWSLPSHASLFTGRYPSSHGAHAEHRFLDDRFPTLAQVLQQNGYETFCFTSNAWISDGLGLTRGFGWQDESLRSEGGLGMGFSFIHRLLDRVGLLVADKGGDLVTTSFEDWAAERPVDAQRPAFVFLNFIEAHFPYHQLPHDYLWKYTDADYGDLRRISVDLLAAQFGGSSPPVAEVIEPTTAMYDGGVLYTDALLGRVVEALRARGKLDDTVLVVLADHGELLGERADYFGHGPSLYQESVGVPLVIRYPPRVPANAKIDTPVSTLGVFATILDLADIEAPPTLQVGSLAPLASGTATSNGGPVLSELHDSAGMGNVRDRDDPQMRAHRRYRLLRDGDLKLVLTSQGEQLLYDLAADPEETREVSAERPEDLNRMLAKLEGVQRDLSLPELSAPLAVGEDAPELDEATQERLRALGYAP